MAGGVDVDGTALFAVVAIAVHGFEDVAAVLAEGSGSTSARVVSVVSVLVSGLAARGSRESVLEERLQSWNRTRDQSGVDFDLGPDENVGAVVWDILGDGPDVKSVDTSAGGDDSNATNGEDTDQSNSLVSSHLKSKKNWDWEQENPDIGENVERSLGEVDWLKIFARTSSLKQDLGGPGVADFRAFPSVDEDHDNGIDRNNAHGGIDDDSVCLCRRDLVVEGQDTELDQAQVEEIDQLIDIPALQGTLKTPQWRLGRIWGRHILEMHSRIEVRLPVVDCCNSPCYKQCEKNEPVI